MKKKGLPDDYIKNTSAFIEHPSEMIPIRDGFFTLMQIERIKLPTEQVRKYFDEQGMEELIQSIKQNGLIQPIVVREENSSIYLVSGERRFRACKSLNIEKIPVIFTNREPHIISLIENLQREDLTPFEEASAYYSLKIKYKVTLSELSNIVGKDYKYISRIMKLVELPDSIKDEFVTSRISKELLIRISQINDKEEQLRVWNILKTGDFTVKEAKSILKTKKQNISYRGFNYTKVNKHINSIHNELKKLTKVENAEDIDSLNNFILKLENFISDLKKKIQKSDNEVNNSDNGII